MAQRIVLPVLGGAMAPYGSHAPQMQSGNISENWSLDVLQCGRGVDTTASIRAQYPFALSYIRVTNTYATVPNHDKAQKLYLSINAAAVNTLAG
jgi:hypothetical protein